LDAGGSKLFNGLMFLHMERSYEVTVALRQAQGAGVQNPSHAPQTTRLPPAARQGGRALLTGGTMSETRFSFREERRRLQLQRATRARSRPKQAQCAWSPR